MFAYHGLHLYILDEWSPAEDFSQVYVKLFMTFDTALSLAPGRMEQLAAAGQQQLS